MSGVISILLLDFKKLCILLYISYILPVACVYSIIKFVIDKQKNQNQIISHTATKRFPYFTFYNTKGGVGKTSIIFLLVYNISQCKKDILLIDCSILKDLTNISISTAKYINESIPTIDDIITKLNNGLCPTHISDISAVIETKYNKIHLITNNRKICGNIVLNTKMFVNTLNKLYNKKSFIVLVDTDSGVIHRLTLFAILLSNMIIIPIKADMQYARQINYISKYINHINESDNFCFKKLMIIFNNLKTIRKNNIIASHSITPFSISKKSYIEVLSINVYLKKIYGKKLPEIMYVRAGSFIFKELQTLEKKNVLSIELVNDLKLCIKIMFDI